MNTPTLLFYKDFLRDALPQPFDVQSLILLIFWRLTSYSTSKMNACMYVTQNETKTDIRIFIPILPTQQQEIFFCTVTIRIYV